MVGSYDYEISLTSSAAQPLQATNNHPFLSAQQTIAVVLHVIGFPPRLSIKFTGYESHRPVFLLFPILKSLARDRSLILAPRRKSIPARK